MSGEPKPAGPNCDDQGDTWEKDQESRGYYYDDAHGYEIYDGKDEENDNDDENEKEPE